MRHIRKVDRLLLEAMQEGSVEQLEAAIAKGANVNLIVDDMLPVLAMVALNHDCPLVDALIKHGADVNARDWEGRTPLFWMACLGREKDGSHAIIDRLVEAGADINAKDIRGRTALDLATTFQNKASIPHIIAHGAKPSPQWRRWVEKNIPGPERGR